MNTGFQPTASRLRFACAARSSGRASALQARLDLPPATPPGRTPQGFLIYKACACACATESIGLKGSKKGALAVRLRYPAIRWNGGEGGPLVHLYKTKKVSMDLVALGTLSGGAVWGVGGESVRLKSTQVIKHKEVNYLQVSVPIFVPMFPTQKVIP